MAGFWGFGARCGERIVVSLCCSWIGVTCGQRKGRVSIGCGGFCGDSVLVYARVLGCGWAGCGAGSV